MNNPAENILDHPSSNGIMPAKQFDLSPKSLDEAMRLADILSSSEIVPKDFQGKPGNILVAIQWGMEIGLKPMQSMQNIAVINGRPSLWGDAVIALVRNSHLCEYIYESTEGTTAICKVKRKGEEEQIRTFSDEDAKAAGLLNKSGPWTQYRSRMRQMRARAFAVRDVFPDVLKGIPVAEEVMDYQDINASPPKESASIERVIREYPQDAFEKNFPSWEKAMLAGKANIAFITTKTKTIGEFTEDQLSELSKVEAKRKEIEVNQNDEAGE